MFVIFMCLMYICFNMYINQKKSLKQNKQKSIKFQLIKKFEYIAYEIIKIMLI